MDQPCGLEDAQVVGEQIAWQGQFLPQGPRGEVAARQGVEQSQSGDIPEGCIGISFQPDLIQS